MTRRLQQEEEKRIVIKGRPRDILRLDKVKRYAAIVGGYNVDITGESAEHLVMYELLWNKRLNAELVNKTANSYDIVWEVTDNPGKFLRIQVKSANAISTRFAEPQYSFYATHGNGNPYTKEQIDWFAFVALDIAKIAFVPIETMTKADGTVKESFRVKINEFDKWSNFP